MMRPSAARCKGARVANAETMTQTRRRRTTRQRSSSVALVAMAVRIAGRRSSGLLAAPPAGAPWLLNVNIPDRADADTCPQVITRLGRRHPSAPVIRQANPRGETMWWIGPAGDAREAGEGTDFHAVAAGRVSITPLQVDLTDHEGLPAWGQRLGLPR